MQADPLIDGVTDTQGYNRYSYVHNNPLNATDPSGFSAWTRFRDNILKPVIQAVVTAYCIPCGTALAAATTAYYGGDAFDVAVAAFSTYVMASMGQQFAAGGGFSAGDAFVFGVTGGITSTLRGGKFGHGFVSAYTGAVTGGFVRGLDNAAAELIASSVIAGSISEATGGKFANGAVTGAFTWALSQGARAIKTNSLESNAEGIETLENLPDNPEAIYEEGRELAAAQEELNVDESVQFDSRHAFCPETCNTDTIRFRSSTAEGIEFLGNNSNYRLLKGAHWDGNSYIYPGATVSMTITYPLGTKGYREYFIGSGPSGFVVTGAESVLGVIAHETGHSAGIGHGARMNKREYNAIMRAR